jgi:hypothetical protein
VVSRVGNGAPELILVNASIDVGRLVIGSSGRGHPRMMLPGPTAFAVMTVRAARSPSSAESRKRPASSDIPD